MDRNYYRGLAESGLRMPIASHLVLHEKPDPAAILLDGKRLGAVIIETSRRFGMPLAVSLMDLTLEKEALVRAMGMEISASASFHFKGVPDPELVRKITARGDLAGHPRMLANCEALRTIAREPDLVPVGMSIGPFSLLTKLLEDPIVPVFLAGSGIGPDESEDVAALPVILALGEAIIAASLKAQIEAGAKAIWICEPAANSVYFSPNQIREGSSVFEDFVIEPNLRLKSLLDAAGVDLIFHDCGELESEMIRAFARLDPVILSLGSAVKLWEAAPFVPKTTVLFGNLPTKKFYSDVDVPLASVAGLVCEIDREMEATGHPYIVGSECDVLAMSGYEAAIEKKVEAFVAVRRSAGTPCA
jgi:uroporphyrinogen-III decarboxylase